MSVEEVYGHSGVDPWFLVQIEDIVRREGTGRQANAGGPRCATLIASSARASLMRARRLLGVAEAAVRARRHELGIRPVYKRVDTCAAEFASSTAYMYSTYDEECEARRPGAPQDPGPGRRAEPHRPGHRVRLLLRARGTGAMREDGYETIMVNCNPETVSTDYDTSDRLYFEPVTLEDVLEIVHRSSPRA
jgi:carbamoyl-phosphate synthase large subunit